MITEEHAAITVEEVSMQEWAMLAFHAARAPQRVRVAVRTATKEADDEGTVGGARTALWVALAAAMAAMVWWVV